jgi:hypothetical protein
MIMTSKTLRDIPILNKRTLAERVELLVRKENMRYSEAIIHICDELGLDPVDLKDMIITSPLKSKIENQSIQLNTVYGKKRLTTATL